VSLVLALHREGPLLRRSLLSLREAAAHSRAHGISTELVATLDRADEPTRQVLRDFGADGFDAWTVIETDHGSLGPSRNSGIERASGRFIKTADGDDLISLNSITAMCRVAEKAGPGQIVFPQFLYAFGQTSHCWEYFPLEKVTPLAFLDTHPYISRVFAHRTIFQTLRYADVSSKSGYAYEDWHFNAECVAQGLGMTIASDTILFYRQRSGSLLEEANSNSTRQIPPCTLFDTRTWVRITADDYDRLASSGGLIPDIPEEQARYGRFQGSLLQAALMAANAIDPAIDPTWIQTARLGSNVDFRSVAVGIAYHEICKIIDGQQFDEIFLLPFISTGGADRYLRDVMQALYHISPTARMLVVLGETLAQDGYPDRVPPNATVLDLGSEWPHLAMEERFLVTLKLIQSTAPTARLHLRASQFALEFYSKFKSVLHSNPAIFYRFGDVAEVTAAGVVVRPWGFNFVADHVQDWWLVVTDNENIIERDRERIGVRTERWRFLPACHAPDLSISEAVARAQTRKRRVLWASRLDPEKRPDLLLLIASELALRAPDISIDVFGSAVLSKFDVEIFSMLANISYCGPFDDFRLLEHGDYDAFVYTSSYDGMANVVLEAVAAGLPVIAPDVGGLGEMIIDGESGLLLPSREDHVMAAAYAAAIARISNDPELRQRLVEGALLRLIDRHGPVAFAEGVRGIFGGPVAKHERSSVMIASDR